MSSLDTTASFASESPSGHRHEDLGVAAGFGGVREWPRSVVRWLFGRGDEDREEQSVPRTVARFQNICVSRETGAGGYAISRMVGQRLGWKVYDQELLEAIAHRMELPVDDVRVFDELAPSVVQDWLLPLREEHYAPQEAYLDHLAKLIEAIGRAGESVLVGRGAGFLMPRETTLSVRIIAPIRYRSMRLAERMGVSVWTARRAARDLDRRRAQFERTMYRAVSGDPHNYDLVLDSHSLGLDIAAEVIVRAVEAGRPGATRPAEPTWSAPHASALRPDPDAPRPAPTTSSPAIADANESRPTDEPWTGPTD
ncbi:AAA family ATPase [Aquisphaera insulae]|uniref:cytidylate kinase-like family protein n=1 Tax=Aquisphaera insulae TaxID=2712864 RepID=UPI0013EB00BA|nr:cytidylate kinase-like family protein [Aquisphaera insulae]